MVKKITVETRKKTTWKFVINHLKYRKGNPLRLEPCGTMVSILHRKPYDYSAAWGKATVKVSCGLCNAEHTVFVWSLAGGGKSCTCCGSKITMQRTFAWLDKKVPAEIENMIMPPAPVVVPETV